MRNGGVATFSNNNMAGQVDMVGLPGEQGQTVLLMSFSS